jgi:hypothetical protein
MSNVSPSYITSLISRARVGCTPARFIRIWMYVQGGTEARFEVIIFFYPSSSSARQPYVWALAFLISFCQPKNTAIASSDFVTKVFSWVGSSAPRPSPGYPGGPMFSVRVISLSRLVPVLKRQDLAFCMTAYNHCPGAMTWTCMQRTWWE